MATNHTTNYNLNLWEPTDKFSREEINENTQKLDAALGAHQAAISGAVVTGTFTTTPGTQINISLGFRPKMVALLLYASRTAALGVLLEAMGVKMWYNGNYALGTNIDGAITDDGFYISQNEYVYNSDAGNTIHYIAFR